jgi:WD40 repeat protein
LGRGGRVEKKKKTNAIEKNAAWDTRKFKTPLATLAHASTSSQHPTSSIRFSPDARYILTGSATGHLHLLNPATLRAELVTPVTPGAALVAAEWHAALNQIVTGSANAETHVLYSPRLSAPRGGALLVMARAPKRRHIDDDPSRTTDTTLSAAAAAAMASGGGGGGARAAAAAGSSARHPTVGLTVSGRPRDPRRPHLPAQTPFAKSQPDERHIREHIPLSSMRDEDPREALLKYADVAAKDPIFTRAWQQTQPKP